MVRFQKTKELFCNMKKDDLSKFRALKSLDTQHGLVVVGGGLAGVCAALAAARAGARVALIQDRPVLGGNASSEVRLWALGATSHMGNNNRWSREGGVVDEIMVENMYRNKEGNPVIFDTVLLDKVLVEPRINLYLNTAVFSVVKSTDQQIEKVVAFNAQNSTLYNFHGTAFIDASGDGIVAYQAGVPYRIGAETADEFNELLAPNVEDYGELLGHTLFFYSRKEEQPVRYTAPHYALKDMSRIPRIKNVRVGEDGCKLWWFEYGGRRDTIHDTEEIKLELWKVAYGIWNHIKNSGAYEGTDHYTLEWVGLIPGKRESRRFEGHHMLHQQDLVDQRQHTDAISYGGWAMDLHPADGIYSGQSGCTQWHTKGVYQIPYGCYVPRGIDNLLLAGRIISASHVAFGSSRVMATCAHGGQAVGMAAALSLREGVAPARLLEPQKVGALQDALTAIGHYIPEHRLSTGYNLAEQAAITTTSTLILSHLPAQGAWEHLTYSMAQMIPVTHRIPGITVTVRATEGTPLTVSLRVSSKPQNHTPDVVLEEHTFPLEAGEQRITIQPQAQVAGPCYLFVCLLKNEAVSVALTDYRLTGLVSVFNGINPAVSNYGQQDAPEDIGIDSFEFWCPRRRPGGANMAFELSEPLPAFEGRQLTNGVFRPVEKPNAWVADLAAEEAMVSLQWSTRQTIHKLTLFFDPDYDHPMETVQMRHPESMTPFMVQDFEIYTDRNTCLKKVTGNYQAVHEVVFDTPLKTDAIILKLKRPSSYVPIAMMGVVCV